MISRTPTWKRTSCEMPGGGVDLRLSRAAALRLEARDYMSMFDPELTGLEDELQHDVVLSAGLSFTFGPGPISNGGRVLVTGVEKAAARGRMVINIRPC